MKKRITTIVFALICLIFASTIWATGVEESGSEKGPVTVASKIDTEGALLGNMIALLLEDAGFAVVNRVQLGPTDVVRKAIKSGEIDIYPEYTGNGAFFYPDNGLGDVWKNPRKGWEAVKKLDMDAENLVWLTPAPANNTWAIAVRQDVADANNLKTLSDFGRWVSGGGNVKLAGSEEFVSRPDSLPAFESTYGFKLEKNQLLVLSGGNTATTEQAAARGTDGVNAAMAYGTDGQLAALGLVVMEDDKEVQPVYEPAPLVRAEVLDTYPEIDGILKPVFSMLDLETLQYLNSQIAVEGRPAVDVAAEWLMDQGIVN